VLACFLDVRLLCYANDLPILCGQTNDSHTSTAHDSKRARVDGAAAQGPKHDAIHPAVRFVPKKSSVRAITNMSRQRREVIGGGRSSQNTLTNSSLYSCLYVLRHMVRQTPGVLGFGVDGVEEGCRLLRNYKLGVATRRVHSDFSGGQDNGDKYFVAVLDLEKCFDSVNTAQLYDILKSIVLCKEEGDLDISSQADGNDSYASNTNDADMDSCYVIHKYSVTHFIKSAERFVCRSIRHVTEDSDFISCQGKGG
jgi:hypothetical protein